MKVRQPNLVTRIKEASDKVKAGRSAADVLELVYVLHEEATSICCETRTNHDYNQGIWAALEQLKVVLEGSLNVK